MSTVINRSRSTAFLVTVAAVATVAVAGCTAGPELRIDQAPVAHASLGAISFITKEADERPVAAMKSALTQGRGVGEGDDWHVLATLAVRPADVGTFSDVDARGGEWAETPRVRGARREPGLHVLTAVATRADGSDKRVVRVSGRGPVDYTPDALLASLAKLAADALIDGQAAVVANP